MNKELMLKRAPDSRFYGKGVLKDYSLGFTIYEEGRWSGGGCADVIYRPGEEVWGLAYTVSPSDAEKLDLAEGEPYRRINKTIEMDGGERIEAFLYEVIDKMPHRNPSVQYLNIFKRAAEKHQFPEAYKNFLGAIKTID